LLPHIQDALHFSGSNLEVAAGEVQRVLDVRQRDVHDGRVEHDHELRRRDHHERKPEPSRWCRLTVLRRDGSRDGSVLRLA
jgi:hypothetical protein